MRASYTNLQRKYQKQLISEKSDFSMHLCNLEKENEALKTDYEKLRQKNEQTILLLRQQLTDEKNTVLSIQKRCDELHSQLETKIQEEIDHKNITKESEKQHQLAVDELKKQLDDHKHTIRLQAEELMVAKASLTNKNSEIHRLSHETELKKTDLINSQKSVKRLEKTVAKHLNLLLHRKQNSASSISVKCSPTSQADSSSSVLPQQSPIDQEEISQKVRYLEDQLNEANNALIEKMLEISRLENTCQTASATIRRLVESKTYSNGQTKSLDESIDEACERVKNFEKKLVVVEKDLSSKLCKSMSEISRLKRCVHEFQAFKQYEVNHKTMMKYSSDVGVQTARDLISQGSLKAKSVQTLINDQWTGKHDFLHSYENLLNQNEALHNERTNLRTRLSHQLLSLRKLQQDNVALSDLLTNAEKFNRKCINCFTDLNSTPPMLYNVHCVSPGNSSLRVVNSLTKEDVNNSQIVTVKNHSTSLNTVHNEIDFNDNPYSRDTELLKTAKVEKVTENKLSSNQKVKQINQPNELNESIQRLVPPLHLSSSSSPSPSVKPSDCNLNSNGNALITSYKGEYKIVCQDLSSTSPETSEHYLNCNSESSAIGSLHDTFRVHYPNNSSVEPVRIVSTSVPHFSVTSKHNSSLVDSHVNSQFYHLSSMPTSISYGKAISHLLYDSPSSSTAVTTTPLLIQSNLNNSQVGHNGLQHNERKVDEVEEEEEEDTAVYNLAAKFLADEQKHSILLEQQIDAHLKNLKEHAAHFNGF
ncbi:unnamed protein product [Heterobilharzia americana]|nr:unnamed protein product [Heterobilharzia americana]